MYRCDPGPKPSESSLNTLQTVCPVPVNIAPPHSCTSMPRCSRYQSSMRSLFLALKKMPPMPVTRSSTKSSALLEGNDEPHGHTFGGLGTHRTRAVTADEALHALQLRIGDPGDVAIRDLQRLAVDHAIADRPAEEPVVRIDLREPVGETALQIVDRFTHRAPRRRCGA